MAEIAYIMPEIEGEEMLFVGGLIKDMSDDQARTFAVSYRTQRRDPTTSLLLTLLGFVVLAGVQRFYLGQIGMGLVYLFTAGFCFIGTIIDLVNYKSLTFKYNQAKAQDLATIMSVPQTPAGSVSQPPDESEPQSPTPTSSLQSSAEPESHPSIEREIQTELEVESPPMTAPSESRLPTEQEPQTSPASPMSSELIDELEKLADLHDRGILTDEEFQSQKDKLLG